MGDDEPTRLETIRSNWNGFRHFMWNSEEKTVMGRGGKSWAKISLFYFVYYTCLAGFWAALLAIFLQTVSFNRPTWTALVSTPGLSVVPVPNEDFRISWEPDRPESYERITKEIAEIIDGLQPPNGDDLEDCTTGPAGSIANGQRFCGFDVAKLGPCNNPPNYGWDTLKPCLFLRLNRVFGWIPENYDNKDDIPERVQEAGIYMDDNVAIGCFPRRDDDKKIIVNATTMPFPRNGIPFGFFPYALGTNMEDRNRLIQPVVAVQVPFSIANEGVNLECETYTGNILPRNGLFDTDELSRFRIHLTPKRDN